MAVLKVHSSSELNYLGNGKWNFHIARPFTNHVIHKLCLHCTQDFCSFRLSASITVWKLTKQERGYQFMHGKDFWPTKLIYFPHTGSIIFQGCNNCSSNINNIYRLDSANKTLLGIYTQKVQKVSFIFSLHYWRTW